MYGVFRNLIVLHETGIFKLFYRIFSEKFITLTLFHFKLCKFFLDKCRAIWYTYIIPADTGFKPNIHHKSQMEKSKAADFSQRVGLGASRQNIKPEFIPERWAESAEACKPFG